MSQNHAIIVGLTKYPGISDLDGPENDAKWFRDWLVTNKHVPAKNAELIVSSDFKPTKSTANATRFFEPGTAAVDRAFENLIDIGGQDGQIGDRLYLFFSGHGFAQTLNDAALLMSNCDIKRGVTGHHVTAVTYADFFAMSAYFNEVVLFMDCCRDDRVRMPARVPPWEGVREVDGADVKRFYALAVKWSQKARDGAVVGGKVHGHFTRALMAALDGGAVAGNGELSTDGVKNFTINYVQSVIGPELDKKGEPRTEPDFVHEDRIVLAAGLTPAETAVAVNFGAATAAGAAGYTVAGGHPMSLTRNPTGVNPWKMKLPLGRYAVLRPDGKSIAAEFEAFGQPVVVNV